MEYNVLMELYKQYLKERDSAELHFSKYGFVTFSIAPDFQCYLSEIFVVKEKRKSREAYNLYKYVLKQAALAKCRFILGSVDFSTNGAELSAKLMKKLGFVEWSKTENLTWFRKNL